MKFRTKTKYFRDLLVTCVTRGRFEKRNLNWNFTQT